MTYLGRDFSSFQGDLTDPDCEGISFAYVKATQGDGYKNPDAVQQCSMLRKHGVAVGYYHFFDPTIDVLGQLDNFAKFVQALGPSNLPPGIDIETPAPQGWAQLASMVMDFALGVESWTLWVPNERSLLYVNLSFYRAMQGFPWGRWVWLADPNAGAPHEPCLVLQGAPRPVSSADLKVIDPDTFIGNAADWAAFTRTVAPAPGPAPSPTLYDALVPGYGIPGTPEVAVVGRMTSATGAYLGRMVGNAKPIFAGLGNPTAWHPGFDIKTLPLGTPIAVLYTDLASVNPEVVTHQF